MNNPHIDNDFIQKALRGELSEQEERDLRRKLEQDAAFRESFETEKVLERVLHGLPNVPVATNFTTRVLEELRASQRAETKPGQSSNWFRFKFARVAAGMAAVILLGVLGLQQYRKSERSEMAQTVSAFTEVAEVISSEQTPPAMAFQDFEAIQRLSLPRGPEMDMELLFALQK